MKKLALFTLLFAISCLALANGPSLKKVDVSKQEYSPGDEMTITLEFTGKPTEVSSVELFSREYYYDAPQMKMLQLENKNVWVLKGNVPMDTPPGTHTLEIKALSKDGNEIMGECTGCQYGKTGMIVLKVVQ